MGPPGKQASIDKALGVLDFFTESSPAWTAEMIIEEMGLARATVYRYIQALCRSGLIVPGSGGSYILGPKVMQLERRIRHTDPLLKIVREEVDGSLSPLVGAVVVSSFYGSKVISVYEEKFDKKIRLSMERGVVVPLLYGAPSKVILAHLSPYQLGNFFTANQEEIKERGLGESFEEFKLYMKDIRKRGVCIGSQVDPTIIGVAAPIFYDTSAVSASLCFIIRKDMAGDSDIDTLENLVKKVASKISKRLFNYDSDHLSGDVAIPKAKISGKKKL